VNFNTNIGHQDGNTRYIDQDIIIKATATGGSFALKTITIRLIVCGYEELTLPLESRILYEFHTSLNPGNEVYTIASNYSSNDTDCPLTFYTIYLDDAPPAEATLPVDAIGY